MPKTVTGIIFPDTGRCPKRRIAKTLQFFCKLYMETFKTLEILD